MAEELLLLDDEDDEVDDDDDGAMADRMAPATLMDHPHMTFAMGGAGAGSPQKQMYFERLCGFYSIVS